MTITQGSITLVHRVSIATAAIKPTAVLLVYNFHPNLRYLLFFPPYKQEKRKLDDASGTWIREMEILVSEGGDSKKLLSIDFNKENDWKYYGIRAYYKNQPTRNGVSLTKKEIGLVYQVLSLLAINSCKVKDCNHEDKECCFRDERILVLSKDYSRVYAIVQKREIIIMKSPREVKPYDPVNCILITIEEFPNFLTGLQKIMTEISMSSFV